MGLTKDPNDGRRVDAETQRQRDAEVMRLRRTGTPFRAIAERLDMSLRAVQKAARRAQKLTDALTTGEPGNVIAAVTDDEMTAEDVAAAEGVTRLNALELYRLGFVPDLPADVRAAKATAWAALPRPVTTYPVSNGGSWTAGVDRAMSSDGGTDADDDGW
jgi:hypothetical protein